MAPDDNGIEWLKRRLYSRNDVPVPRPRRRLHDEETDIPEEWSPAEQNKEGFIQPNTRFVRQQRKQSPAIRNILLASLGFFVLSIVIAGYLFFGGHNTVSADKIDIAISGPVAIPGGETLTLDLDISNHNSVPIKLADLSMEYPSGTRSADNVDADFSHYRETLGTLEPGEHVKRTVKAVLFGAEESEQTIHTTLEYRIEGSNAVFHKSQDYKVVLSSAPVTLQTQALSEVSSGQDVQIAVKAHANSASTLQHVILTAQYPAGFQFTSADPKPRGDNASWDLGDLAPGEESTITLHGTLVGEENDQRVFRFAIGTPSVSNPQELGATFNTAQSALTIRKPFIGLQLALDGEGGLGDHVVKSGNDVQAAINWQNNLQYPITDVHITAKLSGSLYDRNQIKEGNGFYKSQDNAVVWSGETSGALSSVNPGESGQVNFSLTPADESASTFNQGYVQIELTVDGRRLSENNVPETLEAHLTRKIKVGTDLQLASRVVYSTGPFKNTGPIPPRAEQDTTYTVMLSVANTNNDVNNAKLTTKLPSYVKYLGNVSPQSEKLSYNPVSGQVTWDIGAVPAGAGTKTSVRQVAFQISLNPSLGQVGSTPQLVDTQTLSGLDRYTGAMVQTTNRELTTELPTDSNVGRDAGKVVR